MIKPTVGRRVWFWPNGNLPQAHVLDVNQPFDAGILFVHDDRKVNLLVSDHMGVDYRLLEVTLLQDQEQKPHHDYFAAWMPYQTEQAKKEQHPSSKSK